MPKGKLPNADVLAIYYAISPTSGGLVVAAKFKTICQTGAKDPWLVMVHGMSQDHRVFSAQVDAFKDDYPILLIDLPGHGLSSGMPGPYGHWEMAAQVADAIEAAGAAHCHYWGTHTGTALGLLLAATRPGLCRSLVLEGTVLPGHVMSGVDQDLQQARDTARTEGLAVARRQWFQGTDFFAVMRQNPGPCRAAEHEAIIGQFSGAPWLYQGQSQQVDPMDQQIAALDLPVLFYNGAHDLPDFVAAADRLETLLPKARRVTVAAAGGFPAWEYPKPVNTMVAEFLTQWS